MTPLTYVLYAVGWFGFGAIAGAQWTRMRREVRLIANAQAGEDFVAPQEVIDERSTRKRRWPRRVLDAFVVMLFVASAVQGFVTYERIQDVVDCQKAYQTGFADALEARSAAAGAERDALIAWMRTLDELLTKTQPGGDGVAARQKFAASTSEYLQKQAELKRKQQENPYPPSPRDVCG
jgi:hypothetical protein